MSGEGAVFITTTVSESRKSPTSRGFTLIELLIVVAILSILAAIAFPAYKQYINKSKVTRAIATLETVRKAIATYHLDYSIYPPVLDITTGQDGMGRVVIYQSLLDEFNQNLSSFVSYQIETPGYLLTARANDAATTLLILRPESVIAQGQ